MKVGHFFKQCMAISLVALVSVGASNAAEIGGVKVDDKVTLAGKQLVLNGVGMRQIFIVKVYAAALYLAKKEKSPEAIQAQDTPRRIALHIQREVDSDEFGQLFITAMNKNSTKEQKAKVINQTVKFGEMFAGLTQPVKKGDVVTLDWIPGAGTVSTLNGKQIGETLQGPDFYNAVLRIWIGEHPVQNDIKKGLLGG